MTDQEAGEAVGEVAEAPRGVFDLLLEVQDHDTAIGQLEHRKAALPEQVELTGVESRLSVLESAAAQVQVGRDELGLRQAALEELIEASRSRRTELERRMYGGQVSAARDLQAMDEEVTHLKRRISELEDHEIEIMEALEPIDGELETIRVEREKLWVDRDRLRAAIAEAVVTIDEDLVARAEARVSAAAAVPSDLLARYEKLRKINGGTGAARLVGGSCSGCHLSLSSMEVDRIRKARPDEVILCDQCGRILVR